MEATDFEALASSALTQIEQALEKCDAGLDFERKEGEVLELEFVDGSKIIVNRHGAAREIWVAARSGGYHFRWDGSAWRDTRSGAELFAALAKLIAEQGGSAVELRG